MKNQWMMTFLTVASVLSRANDGITNEPLKIGSEFEGASVRVLETDQQQRSISFMPGGDPERGWPCWWYFRVDGITPGEKLTLRLQRSMAAIDGQKPLAASWAMPTEATWSIDGRDWQKTAAGQRQDESMIYTLTPDAASVFVAWGPPYTPTTAEHFVRETGSTSPHAEARILCRSREGRVVPLLYVREGHRNNSERFGIWVQARQHAWESGSSWVAQGFAEWLLSDDDQPTWLRQHAEIFIVPIMDVDNTATGNGGKNSIPHDHNRDWSDRPHWNEVSAAKQRIEALIEQGRMDVFLDLHNPAPGDPTFFYVLPRDLLAEPMLSLRDRFIELAYGRISGIRPLIPMSNKPKVTGPNYHPLWKQISSNWVSMNGNSHTVSLCLETIWNYRNSTTSGYKAVGGSLAAAVQEFLAERAAAAARP